MNQVFSRIPYYIPFTFTSVDDDNRLESMMSIPYSVAIYGISMTVSASIQTAFYHSNIQFIDYQTGDTLFDEPLGNFCLQADVRTPWLLPSKWFVKKNSKIICTLDSFDSVTARTYYITLLSHVIEADPNPGIQPFAYSFPISVGFQDQISSGATSVPLGQGMTGTLAKAMLHDFDIHAIAFDHSATGLPFPIMSFQITTQRRKLFDRMIIAGCAGGGSTFSQGDTITLPPASGANVHGWPEDNCLQYWLPQPERVRKGDLVRVDVAPAPTFVPTDSIHSVLNQSTCMALIGNHLV